MQNLTRAVPHLLMSTVVIVSVCILAVDRILTGGEAYGAILAAGGFTLGVTGASGSISAAAATVPDNSALTSAVAHQINSTAETMMPSATAPTPS